MMQDECDLSQTCSLSAVKGEREREREERRRAFPDEFYSGLQPAMTNHTGQLHALTYSDRDSLMK